MAIKISNKIKRGIVKEVLSLKNERPNVAIIVMGKEHIYLDKIKNLESEAKTVGVDTNLYICEASSTENELIEIIELLNNDEMIDAIYLQTPLPENFDFDRIVATIKAAKDVSFEEDFENADWELIEAKIFKSVLEAHKERKINIKENDKKSER